MVEYQREREREEKKEINSNSSSSRFIIFYNTIECKLKKIKKERVSWAFFFINICIRLLVRKVDGWQCVLLYMKRMSP